MNTSKSRFGLLIIGLMMLAASINILQFIDIEQDTRHNYRALYFYDTSNLFEIAIARDNSSRRWVAPFYYFGELFPNSIIIVPKQGVNIWFDFELSMLAFGKAQFLQREHYDPVNFLSERNLQPFTIDPASYAPNLGSTRRILHERVAFIVSELPSGSFLVLTPDGAPNRTAKIVFVDTHLIADELLRELRHGR